MGNRLRRARTFFSCSAIKCYVPSPSEAFAESITPRRALTELQLGDLRITKCRHTPRGNHNAFSRHSDAPLALRDVGNRHTRINGARYARGALLAGVP